MKCLIVCFALLGAALAVYNWKPHELKCVEELGIDKSVIESVGGKKPKAEGNPTYNEFIECRFKKEGWMKSDAELDWDTIYDFILEAAKKEPKVKDNGDNAEDVVKRLIDPCRKVHGDTPGQAGVRAWNCLDAEIAVYRSS